MNNIKDCENLSSKRVLLRLDLNVPLKNGKIVDETRIIKIIPVIEFLIKRNAKILIISHVGRPKGKFNNIIFVGGMANNILSFKGNKIGKSISEENCESIIQEIFEISKNALCEVTYPEDVLIGKSADDDAQIKDLKDITDDDLILDVGPKTLKRIKNIIENSETVLWNGPAGYFENPNFAKGSIEIAKTIIKKNKNNSIYSVVGGGDTVAVVNQINAIKDFNFVSTAGGAFLEYLEGKELPGIKALN